ncbi:MAG: PRC-barrel domain-containing protein [Actinobacteria bacterium]|nr:PRC-barrel domain-containing protein [Actinomycetota bacterium]
MMRSVIRLGGYRLQALNGDRIGRVHDFLFDDRTWTVRYLVLRTGGWLSRRKKLISPVALGEPEWSSRTIPVMLSVKQIKESPDISVDKPVSLQREVELHEYFGWEPYWSVEEGSEERPSGQAGEETQYARDTGELEDADPHLRSVLEILTYKVQASDGKAGRIADLLLEEESWVIRYLVIKTSFWRSAKRVLISPLWMKGVSWQDRRIIIDMPVKMIINSPTYNPSIPFNGDFEARLNEYYGRQRKR